jgi:hypothetical protein
MHFINIPESESEVHDDFKTLGCDNSGGRMHQRCLGERKLSHSVLAQ